MYFRNKLENRINHGFALTYNMQKKKKKNTNEFEIYTFQGFQI